MNASPICFTTRPFQRTAASRTRAANRSSTCAALRSPIASVSGVKLERSTNITAAGSLPGGSSFFAGLSGTRCS